MTRLTDLIHDTSAADRQRFIVESFTKNYAQIIAGDPAAWRGKFRKMASSAFAFYRGSAALFFADVSRDEDPFLNQQTSRVWIQGDLHAENFGTYMNSSGVLVFDVNDFDEAYVGPFTWDVKRFLVSLALIGYQKAMSDAEIREVLASGARGYAHQVSRFAAGEDADFALTLANTSGKLLDVLRQARLRTRVSLLEAETTIVDGDRRLIRGRQGSDLDAASYASVKAALEGYYETIPSGKRRAALAYEVKDIIKRRGLGIGSAGLNLYSVLIEGENQALENDILISLKEAKPAAPSLYVLDEQVKQYFLHDGQRSAVSQRALQSHADPLLGYTTLNGRGMYVAEVSPYTAGLEWDEINDMDDILQVVELLGRCIAKIHCCSDDASDQTLVPYCTEAAINGVLDGRETDFVTALVDFSERYAAIVRRDHLLFADAFRNRLIPGI
ncbi:MAG: DUF2252 domain-containing protein [Chloroflexales bacterium]|nr:DUF2252 domain-containing protein [Chloroflexales bacterium]